MNGRRQFLKGAGLFSALFTGAVVARGATATTLLGSPSIHDGHISTNRKAIADVIKQIEDQSTASLQLQQTYGQPAPMPAQLHACFSKNYVPGTEKVSDVRLTPGPDGNLYIQVNGQWRKVVTE